MEASRRSCAIVFKVQHQRYVGRRFVQQFVHLAVLVGPAGGVGQRDGPGEALPVVWPNGFGQTDGEPVDSGRQAGRFERRVDRDERESGRLSKVVSFVLKQDKVTRINYLILTST